MLCYHLGSFDISSISCPIGCIIYSVPCLHSLSSFLVNLHLPVTLFGSLFSCFLIFCVCLCVCVCVLSHFSRIWLLNSMNFNPSGSSVHGILQAWILEWVAISSCRGFSWSRDWTCVSCLLNWQAGSLPIPEMNQSITIQEYALHLELGYPRASLWLRGKESAFQWGRHGLNPWVRKNGNPLQYCCLWNPMGRGVWQAIVHGVTKESDAI